MIRPSSLPMLAACPCFESAPDTGERDKDAGTARHGALAAALRGLTKLMEELQDEDEFESVNWAYEYIRVHAPDGHEMRIEQRLDMLDDSFNVIISGTPDVTCGPELFDLKWRERNYDEQMAAYAMAMIQANGWQGVRIHILFAERKFARVVLMTRDDCWNIVHKVLLASKNPDALPVACDYCGWCAKRMTCPALTENVQAIANARAEIKAETCEAFEKWLKAGAHASELTEPNLAGAVLTIAKQIVTWTEAVQYHCKELAIKQGIIPTGFKLRPLKGNRFITSLTEAFSKSGMPQDEFLKLCDIKLTALVEKFGEINGMKKAQAQRTLEEKLGDVIQRKASSVSLVAEKK